MLHTPFDPFQPGMQAQEEIVVLPHEVVVELCGQEVQEAASMAFEYVPSLQGAHDKKVSR